MENKLIIDAQLLAHDFGLDVDKVAVYSHRRLSSNDHLKIGGLIECLKEITAPRSIYLDVFDSEVSMSAYVPHGEWVNKPKEDKPLKRLRALIAEHEVGRFKCDWFEEKCSLLVDMKRTKFPKK